jgi:hypothetical protein
MNCCEHVLCDTQVITVVLEWLGVDESPQVLKDWYRLAVVLNSG